MSRVSAIFLSETKVGTRLVSQFTLYGKMKKGNKPDFHDAAKPEIARRLYDHFFNRMRSTYVPERVKNGVFQAMMEVELKNDGPVGVDYRSEDAAVYFAFLAFVLFAAIDFVLTRRLYRSPLRLIPNCLKKSPSSRKTIARTKTRAGKGPSRPGRHMNFNCQRNYYNDKVDTRIIFNATCLVHSYSSIPG